MQPETLLKKFLNKQIEVITSEENSYEYGMLIEYDNDFLLLRDKGKDLLINLQQVIKISVEGVCGDV